jgi:hypothetical protein
MRPSKTLTFAVLALALSLTLQCATPVLAACGSQSGYADPCMEEYYAKYCADDCYRDEDSNPFRVLAYLVYPVGVGLEWLIFRPLHWVVSRPGTAPIFGHTCEYDY